MMHNLSRSLLRRRETQKKLLALLSIALFLITLPPASGAAVFTLNLTLTPINPVVGQPTIFNATGSSSSGGTIISYSWTFGDGGAVTNCVGKGCANATTTHTYTSAGSFTITLTAVDNASGLSTLTQNIFVNPVDRPPVASFSATPPRTILGNQTSFDGSGSFDPDGVITLYTWNFGDGSSLLSTTAPLAIRRYRTVGNFTATLTVKDDAGTAASFSKNVTIVATDLRPIANFTVTPVAPLTGQSATFDASASKDPDIGGAITSYFWNFGDGTSQSGGTMVAHTYQAPGRYVVKLTVTDNSGLVNSTFRQFQAQQGPGPLTVSVDSDEVQGDAPLDVQFNATAYGGQATYNFTWDFGDGHTATGPYPGHIFTSAGTYHVKVTTTDTLGHTVTNSTTIVVSAPTQAAIGPFPADYLVYGVGGSVAALAAAIVLYMGLVRRVRPRKKIPSEEEEYG